MQIMPENCHQKINIFDCEKAFVSNKLHSDDEILNKIKRLIRSEFKSTFLKRPTITIHINRV